MSQEEEYQQSSAFLFVSLYLVVLAFFILLNSIAHIEQERRKNAIQSVRNTFSHIDHSKDIPTIDSISPVGSQIATKNYFAPVKRLASEILQLTDSSVVEYGNTMQLTISTRSFFHKESATLYEKSYEFFRKLSLELVKHSGKNSYMEVEFLFATAPRIYPSKTPPFKERALAEHSLTLNLARAGIIGRNLVQLGVPQRSVYVGVSDKVQEGNFTITFYMRKY